MAERIAVNAKVQRPGVCNAMETLLVHRDVAERFLPQVAAPLRAAGVELRGCPRTRAVLPDVAIATEDDWRTEYLDLILSVKVVDSLDDAIDFINTYGTGHSDAIVTDSYAHAQRFTAARRLGRRVRQRLDPLHRRLRVRLRRRGRHLHQPPARARSDGPARAHDLQVRHPGHRADPLVTRNAPPRPATSAGRPRTRRPAPLRIGVFGGTFDPIHLAHLRCAEEACEQLGLDRVLFVPAADPPHKTDRRVAPARHRLAMVQLAAAGNPRFRVSTIEIERRRPLVHGRHPAQPARCACRPRRV